MKFEVTKASINHSFVTLLIGIAAFSAYFYLPAQIHPILIAALCSLKYIGRELGDLEKRHGWSLLTWNSAELILPLLSCVALAVAVLALGEL